MNKQSINVLISQCLKNQLIVRRLDTGCLWFTKKKKSFCNSNTGLSVFKTLCLLIKKHIENVFRDILCERQRNALVLSLVDPNYTAVFKNWKYAVLHILMCVCNVWGLWCKPTLTCSEHAMSHSVWCQVLQAKVRTKIVMMISHHDVSNRPMNPFNHNSMTRQT